ncbi:MAG: NUDIX domain-containing protein [Geminicoccaceae bacterium]|nr:NUDIX domain-containing protein [Geminicoccaceae bacterium]
MSRTVEVLEREVAYQGYFQIIRAKLRHEQFRGGLGSTISREIFERGQAVAVLPYDPDRDEVVLVEQFRAGALDAPGEPWLIEPVAGIIEDGETPADVARREAREEAGLEIADLVPVCEYFVSPGGATERCRVFIGRVTTAGAGGIFGLEGEGEDIMAHVFKLDEAIGAIGRDPRFRTASALVSLQWLALNRDRVRRAFGAA